MTETAAGGMGWRRDLAWKVGGARKVGGVFLATKSIVLDRRETARKVGVVLLFLLPRAVTSHKNNSAAGSMMTETAAGGRGLRGDLAWKVGGARKKVGGVFATNVGATRKNGDFLEIAAALGDDAAVTAGGGSPFGTVGGKGHGETRSSGNGGGRKSINELTLCMRAISSQSWAYFRA
jgi:hypothetical protein